MKRFKLKRASYSHDLHPLLLVSGGSPTVRPCLDPPMAESTVLYY